MSKSKTKRRRPVVENHYRAELRYMLAILVANIITAEDTTTGKKYRLWYRPQRVRRAGATSENNGGNPR